MGKRILHRNDALISWWMPVHFNAVAFMAVLESLREGQAESLSPMTHMNIPRMPSTGRTTMILPTTFSQSIRAFECLQVCSAGAGGELYDEQIESTELE